MKIECNRQNLIIGATVATAITGLVVYLLQQSHRNVSSLTLKDLSEHSSVKQMLPWNDQLRKLYHHEWTVTPEYRRMEIAFQIGPEAAELLSTVPNDQLAALQQALWGRARIEGSFDLFEKIFIEHKFQVLDADLETWGAWVAKYKDQGRWDAFFKQDTEAFHQFLRGKLGSEYASYVLPQVPRGQLVHPFGSESFVQTMIQEAEHRTYEEVLGYLHRWKERVQRMLDEHVARLGTESRAIYELSGRTK